MATTKRTGFERALDTNDNDAHLRAPKMRDQRDSIGVPDGTREDIEWLWSVFLRERSPLRLEQPIADKRTVVPYINHGRWVADCPECNGGIACWDENPRGCCLSCGHVYKVKWQPPDERAAACRALGERADRRHWNWEPHRGETVERLHTENVLREGLAPEHRADAFRKAGLVPPDEVVEYERAHRARLERS